MISAPVIIVGNISVGGTGKTPLVIWLAEFLQQQGYQPGIISRGYGGSHSRDSKLPLLVTQHTAAQQCGDEALLLAQKTGCAVAVCRQRFLAAQYLVDHCACDIIISDDGLQHLALQRTVEIVVIDGQRGFGNQYCLPAGPLREPISRLQSVDFLLWNGAGDSEVYPRAYIMYFCGDEIVNLHNRSLRKTLSSLVGKPFHTIAAIGNPQRFFDRLNAAGLMFDTRVFPDHHHYCADDLQFEDDYPVLMTEKDAVKCYDLAAANHWMLPIHAQLDASFASALTQRLEKLNA
jgi:tetraacyldisaccharide 4'-kinase